MQEFGEQVADLFKQCYVQQQETIEYLVKFGSPIQKAKASLIKDIATGK